MGQLSPGGILKKILYYTRKLNEQLSDTK
jgi:energy-converting hydrogenase Eha subunit F